MFDRLLLWRPIYVEHINQSPLQYSTDHPAGLQGLWITNVLAVISLLPRTWDTVKLNLNRHMLGIGSVVTFHLGSLIQGLEQEACGLF